MKFFIKRHDIFRNFLKIMYVFSIKQNRIFFMNFDGTTYGYDAKAMVEYITKNRSGQYEMFWGINDLMNFKSIHISGVRFVKLKSLKSIWYILTSKAVICNINPPAYIPYRKGQVIINSWHSISYKKVGKYIEPFNKKQANMTTHYLSHAQKFTEWVIRGSFEFEKKIVMCGVPRNDIFFDDKKAYETKKRIKREHSILEEEKVLLYAPTFRKQTDYMESGMDFNRLRLNLEKKFGGKWRILFRLHQMIIKVNTVEHEGVSDVSRHQDMQELLCTADAFISDYSGGIWDFALQYKPVFIYAVDIKQYDKDRGVYMPCLEWPFPLCENNEELETAILRFDLAKYKTEVKQYFDYMGSYEKGIASETVLKIIENDKALILN